MSNKKIHSEGVLTDLRDHWWNQDFIALMAKRWRLHDIKSMLDVGCGVGHWGQMLFPYLSKEAVLVGIDPEISWIEKAKERAQIKGWNLRSQYLLGTAENISYPDNHFDMVTCQTVLIHVRDVELALKEMLRVLKPGGLLAVSEPNNVISCLVSNNLNFEDSVDDIIDIARFTLTQQRGVAVLQEGYNSLGDLAPFYFYKAGLTNIKVYLSDLADFFVPPYMTPREQAVLENSTDVSEESWEKEKEQSKRYYLAGGGTEEEFEKFWKCIVKRSETKLNGYKQKNICSAGGELLYLVSGIKAK